MADTTCRCEGIEEFLRSDTGNEFSGVGLVCDLCGREFTVEDVSEPAYREMQALNARKTADALKVREARRLHAADPAAEH